MKGTVVGATVYPRYIRFLINITDSRQEGIINLCRNKVTEEEIEIGDTLDARGNLALWSQFRTSVQLCPLPLHRLDNEDKELCDGHPATPANSTTQRN